MSRLIDLQYRFLDGVRHRDAHEIAGKQGTAAGFDSMRGARQCLIVTFKRSGEPVPTPVNFGLRDGRLYFRSEPETAKVRRIRNDPHVRVCPSNLRGKPTGPVVEGKARVLDGEDAERAAAAVAGNWSPSMKVMERGLDRMPIDIVYVEVTASAPDQEGDDR